MPKTKYEVLRAALIEAGVEFGEECKFGSDDRICGHVIYFPAKIEFNEITDYDKLLNK